MLTSFRNFFDSLFNSEFYNWVAHDRRGVGLSYLFGVSFLITLISTIYCNYYFGTEWSTLIVVENKTLPEIIRIYFSVIIPNELLVMLVLPIICWILLTLIMFNIATIFSATIGQAMNYLYGEALDFDQVLRVNCYVLVVALVMSALFYVLIPSAISIIPYLAVGLVVFYNFYGIMSPKFDF
jgi:hypothetical protein